jgi:hypothetical protein
MIARKQRNKKEPGTRYNPHRYSPSDPHPPAGLHLPKFPPHLKTASPAGFKHPTYSLWGIFHIQTIKYHKPHTAPVTGFLLSNRGGAPSHLDREQLQGEQDHLKFTKAEACLAWSGVFQSWCKLPGEAVIGARPPEAALGLQQQPDCSDLCSWSGYPQSDHGMSKAALLP